jgi:hypothetical protein
MMGWQSIIVGLIILAASFYVGRQVWGHIRAFGKGKDSGCATGCGNCPGSKTPVASGKPIIQLSRSKAPAGRLN